MGPLCGIRIIELAGLGPGPYCGMMLADMGAEVIRVERKAAPNDSPASRDPTLRSRKSVALNLKHPLGVDALPDHWQLASMLLRVDSVIKQAVESLELAAVAKHAYLLAQAFNSFYHKFPVAQEEQLEVRAARSALVRLYHDEMVDLLDLMGIAVPDRM